MGNPCSVLNSPETLERPPHLSGDLYFSPATEIKVIKPPRSAHGDSLMAVLSSPRSWTLGCSSQLAAMPRRDLFLQTEIKPLIKTSSGILNGQTDRSISSWSLLLSLLKVDHSGDKMLILTKGVIRLGNNART